MRNLRNVLIADLFFDGFDAGLSWNLFRRSFSVYSPGCFAIARIVETATDRDICGLGKSEVKTMALPGGFVWNSSDDPMYFSRKQ